VRKAYEQGKIQNNRGNRNGGWMKAWMNLLSLGLLSCAGLSAAAPESYVWRNVEIGAGGFVPGILFHPTAKGLAYLRTDIGGSYRLDPGAARWTPITDIFSPEDWNLLGTESIALDPSDPNKLYLVAGTYVQHFGSNGAILRSNDQGRHWLRAKLPFKCGANENGRSMGERLAVDPNRPSHLYFATRVKGLWESRDSGATWKQSKSFPEKNSTPNGLGFGFVLFDSASGSKGKDTPILYVGAADPDKNFYQSKDAGVSWALVEGRPKGMLPQHAKMDAGGGVIYLSLADGAGPNGMTKGELWKFEPASSRWTDISPMPKEKGSFGFAGLAIDAQKPGVLMVATMDYWNPGDEIYRSINGGKTWKAVGPKAMRDLSATPYLFWGRPRSQKPGTGNWVGSLEIDPFNSDHVLYGTGATVMGTDDVTAMDRGKATHWKVQGLGVEETAVLSLVSPPQGPHLVSGVGDIGGFAHADLEQSPSGGMLDPIYNTVESVDFAELKPELLLRCGENAPKGQVPACFSQDGGSTWKPLEARPSNGRRGGHMALSADGKIMAWTLQGGDAHFSADLGKSWERCAGLPDKTELISDRQDPLSFYAIMDGKVYRSTDGAKSFTQVASGYDKAKLGAVPGHAGHLFLAAEDGFFDSKPGGPRVWVPERGGLFVSKDAGLHFKRLRGVASADAIGFGKAAPGKNYPAIFIAGKLTKDKQGWLYRSDDEGFSWHRLNSADHQWGWIGRSITGDPRVYGRVYVATNGRGIQWGDLAAR
jgi:photosystem II stability/assembly factor-like uncharacterized protein